MFLIAVFVLAIPFSPTLIEQSLKRIQPPSLLNQTRNINLRPNIVFHNTLIIIQRRSHDEIHERGSISSVIQYRLKALLTCTDGFFDAIDGISIGFGAL